MEGHCPSCFKRMMCISCRPHVDIHKGEGAGSCGQGKGWKTWFSCGRHKWMAPHEIVVLNKNATIIHCYCRLPQTNYNWCKRCWKVLRINAIGIFNCTTLHPVTQTLFLNEGWLQSGDVWICCWGCWLVDSVHGIIRASRKKLLS